MEPTMPVPPPSTIDLIEHLDDLVRELHRLDVHQRRKLVAGLTGLRFQELWWDGR